VPALTSRVWESGRAWAYTGPAVIAGSAGGLRRCRELVGDLGDPPMNRRDRQAQRVGDLFRGVAGQSHGEDRVLGRVQSRGGARRVSRATAGGGPEAGTALDRMVCSRAAGGAVLWRIASAPAITAAIVTSGCAAAVYSTTAGGMCRRLTSAQSARPSRPGWCRSRTSTLGCVRASSAHRSSSLAATPTNRTSGAGASITSRPARIAGWSSRTATRIAAASLDRPEGWRGRAWWIVLIAHRLSSCMQSREVAQGSRMRPSRGPRRGHAPKE
jgi:hypothetical protein